MFHILESHELYFVRDCKTWTHGVRIHGMDGKERPAIDYPCRGSVFVVEAANQCTCTHDEFQLLHAMEQTQLLCFEIMKGLVEGESENHLHRRRREVVEQGAALKTLFLGISLDFHAKQATAWARIMM